MLTVTTMHWTSASKGTDQRCTYEVNADDFTIKEGSTLLCYRDGHPVAAFYDWERVDFGGSVRLIETELRLDSPASADAEGDGVDAGTGDVNE